MRMLQLRLSVDGYAVTRSTQSTNWGVVCYELLGAILDKINGGRIEMGWLRDTVPEPDDDSTELERIRYARAYILEMIEGYLMLDLSRNLVHLRWLLKLIDFRAADEFSWGSAVLATLYREMYRVTVPNKAKIRGPMVTYAIMEMHQSDRVMRQFEFRQPIPVALEELDDEHKIDLRQLNTDYPMVGWNAWPGSSPFPIIPAQPLIYRSPLHEGSHEVGHHPKTHNQIPYRRNYNPRRSNHKPYRSNHNLRQKLNQEGI
ncbi:hypothetical protein J1N35_014944 [Gossypium stocksii]|uniref:Aminotransferase-like plant mobile domain-containing protein n=1 Tax=Gossypium stocksii TaxID=47602 RepID=A0A9D3VWB1_9ROSI|nr:hypothetical protein J1N35_014944 [Gossypium stocksii]